MTEPWQMKLVEGPSSCLCTFYRNGKASVMVLDLVYTEPAERRKGHGRRLLEKAIALARDERVDSIELVVSPGNHAAKALYESVGMERIPKDTYRLILNRWESPP